MEEHPRANSEAMPFEPYTCNRRKRLGNWRSLSGRHKAELLVSDNEELLSGALAHESVVALKPSIFSSREGGGQAWHIPRTDTDF